MSAGRGGSLPRTGSLPGPTKAGSSPRLPGEPGSRFGWLRLPAHKRESGEARPGGIRAGMGGGVARVIYPALPVTDRTAGRVCVAGNGCREACLQRHWSRGDTEPVEEDPTRRRGVHVRFRLTVDDLAGRRCASSTCLLGLARAHALPSRTASPPVHLRPAPAAPRPRLFPPEPSLVPPTPLHRAWQARWRRGRPAGTHRHASTRLDTQ